MLYNSICHKDYTGSDIQMHVYDDHVEIWNEGELPEGYNEEVLYGKHSSKPRNRNIADTMFKAGFIDTWGRGYKKIQDGFKAAGLPMPTVKSELGGTTVTFKRGYDVVSGRKNVVSDVVSDVVSVSQVIKKSLFCFVLFSLICTFVPNLGNEPIIIAMNKIVLITGATSGIGLACAKKFAGTELSITPQ